jgi:clan AA aspartic protease (TIGR02281 family)
MSWVRKFWLVGAALVIGRTASTAQEHTITVHPEPKYAVDGLAVGALVKPHSTAYRQYVCKPSEQYMNFTRCHESHSANGIQISRTILRASSLITWYVNKELSPAYFKASDIDSEINRLSNQFGSMPHIYRLNETHGFPEAIIATFGGVELQPLKPNDLVVLAQGKSPHIGILIDFLNNFHQSAKARLPVYKLSGSEGFAWIANYDRQGKGTLRFFAADPSQMKTGSADTSELSSDTLTVQRPEQQRSLSRAWDTKSTPFMVAMENVGGVYQVPIRINDTITLDAIVDSGATDVGIPADVVLTLMRSKTISTEDFTGSQTYMLADGSKVPSQQFKIKSLKVGNKTLENVIASIISVNAQILLGQSFLSRFSSWSIDNEKHALILN